ncbi:L-threonylcarbamoyladenylate synthase, partial [Hydrotalea sp.]|uniref:L-threonylcarbamoyladenylate synthase n=1 Tax=Hydrotalea sp. TaxID=2881279 RepID=UPI0026165BD6
MQRLTSQIKRAIELLHNDDVIAIPTETVYGLAGNVYSEKATSKIFKLKNRPSSNPLIVHIKSLAYLENVAIDIPDTAIKLAETFFPGALTLVLKKQTTIPDSVTAGKVTVAVRVPNHPVTISLLEQLNFPLAAPGANPFGSISPTSAEHVYTYFKDKLSLILDGGICQKGLESTIIGFQNNQPILYRHGSISVEEIESVIGKLKIITKNETTPDAPGMLSKHYAPITKTFLTSDVNELIKKHFGKKIGLLLFDQKIPDATILHQEILSSTGSLEKAASNLYSALHRLDKLRLDVIIAERFPDAG